jgi:hypothetical protein
VLAQGPRLYITHCTDKRQGEDVWLIEKGFPRSKLTTHNFGVLAQGPRLYITHCTDKRQGEDVWLIGKGFPRSKLTTQNFVSPKLAVSPTSTSRFVYCIDATPFLQTGLC